MTSSAGWKISRTRPGSWSAIAAQREAGAEQRRGVQVVAAGVRDALDRAGPRVVGAVVDRERVEVGAQRDERPGPEPMSTIRPLRGSGVGTRPTWSSRLAITEVVRSSAQDSSGWACRSRRTSISWSDSASTPASTDWSRPGWSIGAAEVTTDKTIGPVVDRCRPSARADRGEPEDEARREHPVAREDAGLVDAGRALGHEGAAEAHLVAGLEVGQRPGRRRSSGRPACGPWCPRDAGSRCAAGRRRRRATASWPFLPPNTVPTLLIVPTQSSTAPSCGSSAHTALARSRAAVTRVMSLPSFTAVWPCCTALRNSRSSRACAPGPHRWRSRRPRTMTTQHARPPRSTAAGPASRMPKRRLEPLAPRRPVAGRARCRAAPRPRCGSSRRHARAPARESVGSVRSSGLARRGLAHESEYGACAGPARPEADQGRSGRLAPHGAADERNFHQPDGPGPILSDTGSGVNASSIARAPSFSRRSRLGISSSNTPRAPP